MPDFSIDLFHGSRSKDPYSLIEDENGLDPNYSDGGLWGRAVYFAEKASYSHNYSWRLPNGVHQIFLCRVFIGKYHECPSNKNIRNPPPGFTSVKGLTSGSNVYMVYKNDRAFIDAIITYSL